MSPAARRTLTPLAVVSVSALVFPVLKALAGRLRPVVAHPAAYGTGDSHPPPRRSVYRAAKGERT